MQRYLLPTRTWFKRVLIESFSCHDLWYCLSGYSRPSLQRGRCTPRQSEEWIPTLATWQAALEKALSSQIFGITQPLLTWVESVSNRNFRATASVYYKIYAIHFWSRHIFTDGSSPSTGGWEHWNIGFVQTAEGGQFFSSIETMRINFSVWFASMHSHSFDQILLFAFEQVLNTINQKCQILLAIFNFFELHKNIISSVNKIFATLDMV